MQKSFNINTLLKIIFYKGRCYDQKRIASLCNIHRVTANRYCKFIEKMSHDEYRALATHKF